MNLLNLYIVSLRMILSLRKNSLSMYRIYSRYYLRGLISSKRSKLYCNFYFFFAALNQDSRIPSIYESIWVQFRGLHSYDDHENLIPVNNIRYMRYHLWCLYSFALITYPIYCDYYDRVWLFIVF